MANDPKNFRIPKDFTLFGHRYTVVMEDELFVKESAYGTADEDAKRIRIQKVGIVEKKYPEIKGEPSESVQVLITDETVIETFYHELCHIIFAALGEEELGANEKLVNMMGKSFLELYLSANYEEEKSR